MKVERILKREDGSRVKLSVYIDKYGYSSGLRYVVFVYTCEKGKRTWLSVYSTDFNEYRKLKMDERDAYILAKQLLVVTAEEIYQAKLEVWELNKPKLEVTK